LMISSNSPLEFVFVNVGLMISSNSPLEFVFVNVIRYCGSYLNVIDRYI
jgi:hypothetical protein